MQDIDIGAHWRVVAARAAGAKTMAGLELEAAGMATAEVGSASAEAASLLASPTEEAALAQGQARA
jgi:hypothetical protein